ncbi:MAG: CpsD/CapB family tyrosine-protein kinase [Ignavibacteria bacterium]|nr:CpsD/CapB family tyrosine-protein kinase [Ignavibacteria bacterium]MBI3766575.1 CpsD/CapB family tyrosine-protein kinase [Ignavibacteriales bacterium]
MNDNDSELHEKFTPAPDRENTKLVRLIKSIEVNPEKGKFIDNKVVKFKYYNAFNYSLLSRGHEEVNMTLGITSPKHGEGKTLVACNLAVSLAMGSQKKTVLVDLNIANPRLHKIFGVPQSPGLTEAFLNGSIHISRTAIEHLSVLPSGRCIPHQEKVLQADPSSNLGSAHTVVTPTLGLEQLPAFRDVIYSLEQEFEFVIVDMPAIHSEGVPILFANQLNGLLVVVDSGKTKREEIDAMFHYINERQVLGFVFNRFNEKASS